MKSDIKRIKELRSNTISGYNSSVFTGGSSISTYGIVIGGNIPGSNSVIGGYSFISSCGGYSSIIGSKLNKI